MRLVDEAKNAISLKTTPLHLGPGARARAIEGFGWEPERLQAYAAISSAEGDNGRLVTIIEGDGPGDHWERHPGGDEVVICLSGSVRVVRDDGGKRREVRLLPGSATINPAGVWHAVHFDAAGSILTITPGVGSEHAAEPPRSAP
jgi:quercetin dioxygenase-like cupin family protein